MKRYKLYQPILLLVFFVLCLFSINAIAVTADLYPFSKKIEQQRFFKMTSNLRCLVCQNQNIADSRAPLAKDLRDKVYQMVKQGVSDEVIERYFTQRYGDFVLFQPSVNSKTYLLWFGPFVLLLFSLLLLFVVIYRRRPEDV